VEVVRTYSGVAMATGFQVVFDCIDPDALARFWASALAYELQPPPPGFDSWEHWLAEEGIPEEERNSASAVVDPAGTGPRIFFQRVPEPKTVKNRVHLDLNVSSGRGAPLAERKRQVNAEVERLESFGARPLYSKEERGEYHVTMADPEGNEFCVQ
jgi:hypothetical protein